jgi:hypothetical protein
MPISTQSGDRMPELSRNAETLMDARPLPGGARIAQNRGVYPEYAEATGKEYSGFSEAIKKEPEAATLMYQKRRTR